MKKILQKFLNQQKLFFRTDKYKFLKFPHLIRNLYIKPTRFN
jgi:hypothetical protein